MSKALTPNTDPFSEQPCAAVETVVRFATKGPKPAASEEPGAIREVGGRKDGTDPTRYGDWEKNGRCIDF